MRSHRGGGVFAMSGLATRRYSACGRPAARSVRNSGQVSSTSPQKRVSTRAVSRDNIVPAPMPPTTRRLRRPAARQRSRMASVRRSWLVVSVMPMTSKSSRPRRASTGPDMVSSWMRTAWHSGVTAATAARAWGAKKAGESR